MDDFVISLEHVEAMGEACLGGLKHREIVQILDLVMRIELLQEELQPRRKPGAEVLRGRSPGAKSRGGRLERAGDLAEHVVALQPELRHGPEIGVGAPERARVAVDQQAQVGRQAGAGVEGEGGG
jgi:hypothetical protein